ADSYTDAAGNLGATGSDTVTIDTKNPTVTVAIVATSLSDTTNSSNVTFTFSEATAAWVVGDVTAVSGTLSAFTGSGTSYSATFTATDGVETTGSVTVPADSYTDAAGNLGATGSDTVTIDTLNPTVTAVDVNDTLLTDADVGAGKFTVTVVFSEPMAATPAPTLTFSPAVGSTLSFANGTWTDTRHYTATYNVALGNVDVDAVQIAVTGAKDAAGSGQQAYTPTDEFGIDIAVHTWQNPRHPCDVNDDGFITAVDVLILINEINFRGSRDLATAQPPTPAGPPFRDPSGDVWLTAADVLLVISYINNEGAGTMGEGPGGEGEQVGRLDVSARTLTSEEGAAATILSGYTQSAGRESLSAAECVDRMMSGESANVRAATTALAGGGLPGGSRDVANAKPGIGPRTSRLGTILNAAQEFELEEAISAIAGDIAGAWHL
ncbi:MAG: Ig-like domain-containing protein, partial [Planctomycetota bacterium]|nr:Ig-like domain-containing protein [Planctomycetota bacterium]